MTSRDWVLGGCSWSWRDSPAGDKGLTRKLQEAQLGTKGQGVQSLPWHKIILSS